MFVPPSGSDDAEVLTGFGGGASVLAFTAQGAKDATVSE